MVFIYYYIFYDDLDGQNYTSRSFIDHISAFVEIDQNPEESGFNDFDTTFEDLLNSAEYEEFFTETEEKLEEESLEILNDRSGFLGEKYDLKEVSFFLFWGYASFRLQNDEYKTMLSYYNPFSKIKELGFVYKKRLYQNYSWYKNQSAFLEESFLNFSSIYFFNNHLLDLVDWSYTALYLNFKDRLNCTLTPLDYFESTFYFLPDPEIQENCFDFKKKNNFYFVMVQDNVKIPDWDDVESFLIEPDLNDIFEINLRAHYVIFENIYSVKLNLINKRINNFKTLNKIFQSKKSIYLKNSLLSSLKLCFFN